MQYIFLDKLSMLSCRDMYLISARLAKVMNNLDTPFRGVNMIFVGDFAQLPPVIGQQHASLYSWTTGKQATSLWDQEAAISKALWHQVTTVVILHDNMRQQTQSPEDVRFCEALANMWYKGCTPNDITFLKSRVSSWLPGWSNITEKEFWNVAIITTLNSVKDEINCLGGLRFAAEMGQQLSEFISIDTIPGEVNADVKHHRQTTGCKRVTRLGKLSPKMQQNLWEQPCCTTDKLIPEKLALCIGMPVMIQNNTVTELCITKGQEATMQSWQSISGPLEQKSLDTLFVKLQNPPSSMKFDRLCENVVPLTRNSVVTSCQLPDNMSINVSCHQVEVHPNVAMTNYASQGKTWQYNVVDLSYSQSHQAYYTVLLKGISVAGTLILGSFHLSKIMGGASGALCQEFRELELLDNITLLWFEEKLPRKVAIADHRNPLIALFREYKGLQYMPSMIHDTLRWSKWDLWLE